MEIPPYPVVDLFAGPGGLGEGFAAVSGNDSANTPRFLIAASIEHNPWAHKTLRLRHFFRSFPTGSVPEDYYRYLYGAIDHMALFDCHSGVSDQLDQSVHRITLGPQSHAQVRDIITRRLANTPLWVLVGGPPCQAYSTAGRSRMKTMQGFEDDERHFLYREYLQILADHRPPVFVMENVRGLLSAKHKERSVIQLILSDLQSPCRALDQPPKDACRYELNGLAPSTTLFRSSSPKKFLVKAHEFGVPQKRERVFIVGVRSDLNLSPSHLKQRQPPTVRQFIGHLPPIRSGITCRPDNSRNWMAAIKDLRNVSFDGYEHADAIRVRLDALFKADGGALNRSSTAYAAGSDTCGDAEGFVRDPRVRFLTHHETRSHMPSDLRRYAFATAFADLTQRSPKLNDFPHALLPNHRDVVPGRSWQPFPDRFRVQLPDRVATTITAHMSKDGHAFIHYDTRQCRSLTVREAARLQTFPDNYKFEGPRTEQYRQVGNAVPPYLAYQIGQVVADLLDEARERM